MDNPLRKTNNTNALERIRTKPRQKNKPPTPVSAHLELQAAANTAPTIPPQTECAWRVSIPLDLLRNDDLALKSITVVVLRIFGLGWVVAAAVLIAVDECEAGGEWVACVEEAAAGLNWTQSALDYIACVAVVPFAARVKREHPAFKPQLESLVRASKLLRARTQGAEVRLRKSIKTNREIHRTRRST